VSPTLHRSDATARPIAPGPAETFQRRPPLGSRILKKLSFRNVSALYIFVFCFALFSVWVPDLFLTGGTWKSLLNGQAITVIIAIGLVVPIAAGVFDLAIGVEVGMAGVLSVWLTVDAGVPLVPALILTILAGGVIGVVSGVLVVRFRIDSFIATIGMMSILLAMTAWVSSGQQIVGVSETFQKIGNNSLLGITYPVWIMLVLAIAVWYMLEWTSTGRRIYATGGNPDAARLAGVSTGKLIIVSFVVCGTIAAAAGILTSSTLGVGDPTIGPSYLLPAFSAVFLGSTQLRGGRPNVWGTVIAVYVLATGVKGLQLAGGPLWIPDLFNGVALIAAVGLAVSQQRAGRSPFRGRSKASTGASSPQVEATE
jgi:ribose transport system permease protein